MNQMMALISRHVVGYILVNNEGSKVREMEMYTSPKSQGTEDLQSVCTSPGSQGEGMRRVCAPAQALRGRE